MWTDDDRRWALAWQYDREVRLPCGCYPDDVTGPENDGAFVAVRRVCHRHRAIGEAQDAFLASKTDADSTHGVFWQTRKVTDV